MKIKHELKIFPLHFIDAALGAKKASVRKNDRNYKEGDIVLFNEYLPREGYYTGRFLLAEITNICDYEGITDGYIMFSFVLIEEPEQDLYIAGDEIELRKKFGNNVKEKS